MNGHDNPPAFPSVEAGAPNQEWPIHHHGMVLRDYFAAKAMPIIAPVTMQVADRNGMSSDTAAKATAIGCYQLADAMLAERMRVRS